MSSITNVMSASAASFTRSAASASAMVPAVPLMSRTPAPPVTRSGVFLKRSCTARAACATSRSVSVMRMLMVVFICSSSSTSSGKRMVCLSAGSRAAAVSRH
jgi:hypothetical protein